MPLVDRASLLESINSLVTDPDVRRGIGLAFEALIAASYGTARANGFWDPPGSFGEKIALIHSELSEALEADRKSLKDDKLPDFDGRVVELADALIRIFDLAGALKLPLTAALLAKLEYNLSRPYKHGKAY